MYLTKKKEKEELKLASEVKANNEKILSLMADKRDNQLKEMSIEKLEKLLK